MSLHGVGVISASIAPASAWREDKTVLDPDKSDFALAPFRAGALTGRVLAWSSLLVQKIDLRLGGLVVHKLRVNRHRVAEVARHRHDFNQAILFLSGEGSQVAGARSWPARPGDLFIFAGGSEHGYLPTGQGRPTCLVLDFERASRARAGRPIHHRLPPRRLNDLHELVTKLPRKGGLKLADYATVAAVVALLFESHSTADEGPAPAEPVALHARVRAMLLDAANADLPLAEIARRIGYQPDYLNRRLRREAGLGLRELRDSLRLESATRALHAGRAVGDAATAAGFADPGYFARWFKKRTGRTPREASGPEVKP